MDDIPSHPNKSPFPYSAFLPMIERKQNNWDWLQRSTAPRVRETGDRLSLSHFSPLWLSPLPGWPPGHRPFLSPHTTSRNSKFQFNQIRKETQKYQAPKLRGSPSFACIHNPSRLPLMWGGFVPFHLLPSELAWAVAVFKTVLSGQNQKEISICLYKLKICPMWNRVKINQ